MPPFEETPTNQARRLGPDAEPLGYVEFWKGPKVLGHSGCTLAKADFAKAKELDARIRVPDLSASSVEAAKKGTDPEVRF